MAHPIRPASYIEINNFYTVTVYEKGAEVVRMQANLLGPEAFRKATDLYFERHDGQAVTTEDFVRCMADASGLDLSQLQHWYDYAGTPEFEAHWRSTTAAAAHYTLEYRAVGAGYARADRQTAFPDPDRHRPGRQRWQGPGGTARRLGRKRPRSIPCN